MGERAAGNVLFVTVDQFRRDCVGAWGNDVVRTPHLDRLVAGATSFRQHWASTAPCGPSRASLYTGLYAMNHRSVGNGTPLDARHTNVALEARRLGYRPALFGYTDTSVDPRTVEPDDPRLRTYEGVLPGFDPVCPLPSEAPTAWLAWLADQGHPAAWCTPSTVYEPADVAVPAGRGASWRPARYRDDQSEAAFLVGEALTWIEAEHRADRPWFAHVSFLRPHPPYLAPAPWHDLIDPADVPPFVRAPTRDAEAQVHPLAAIATGHGIAGAPEDELDQRQLRATYYGMVGEVDAQLGRLLAGLDALGAADDTLVLVTSDHGDQLGDHWLVEKLGWWDESYAVPLIVRDPHRPEAAGRDVHAVTEHVDLLPTILDWLGAEVPLACDGRSLVPFLEAAPVEPERWRTEAHWEWDFRDPVGHTAEDLLGVTMEECTMVVLRGPRWKYVHIANDAFPDLLFDLEADPAQLVDLAGDPAHAPVVAACAQHLLAWRARHADRTLTGTVLTSEGPRTRRDPRVG